MEVVYATRVWKDLSDAANFYEKESTELRERFLEAVFNAVRDVKDFPTRARLLTGAYRRVFVSGFPYGLIYRVEAETMIYVVALAHAKRKPYYWQEEDL